MNLTEKLNSLYRLYGYRQFKVNKFEEYDYYARNKDFLVSNMIITFTDTNGRLMALKPDVTLSIIKNSKDTSEFTQRMYYNENVYRVSKGSGTFRENFQTGLECIGYIDDYCIFETIMLACLSLAEISENYVLDISDLDILPGVMEKIPLPPKEEVRAVKYIENKNTHDLKKLCMKFDVPSEGYEALAGLISACGRPEDVIKKLEKIPKGYVSEYALEKLGKITLALDKELPGKINVDFSVVSDIKYYNGFIFNGFIEGIPRAVLSGGQYDRLLSGMGKSSKGLGFAVFMDTLEILGKKEFEPDSDVLLMYREDDDLKKIFDRAGVIRSGGKSVSLQKNMPDKARFGEVKTIE